MIKKGNASSDFNQKDSQIGDVTIFRNDRVMMIESLLKGTTMTIFISLFLLVLFYTEGIFVEIFSLILLSILWMSELYFIYQIFWQRRIVVLSPGGLQDSNVTADTIPWSAVERVWPLSGGLTIKRPWAVMLKLKPGAVDTLRFPRRTRLLRLLNKDKLWIAFGFWTVAPGVRLSLDRFSETVSAYARAYGEGVK